MPGRKPKHVHVSWLPAIADVGVGLCLEKNPRSIPLNEIQAVRQAFIEDSALAVLRSRRSKRASKSEHGSSRYPKRGNGSSFPGNVSMSAKLDRLRSTGSSCAMPTSRSQVIASECRFRIRIYAAMGCSG